MNLLKLFTKIYLPPPHSNTTKALEIGLGYFGSTHILWRQIFERVITIEKSHDRIRLFGENTRKHFGKWILNDGVSSFVIGYSYSPSSVEKVYNMFESLDLLFIDGDHQYKSCLTDYLLYEPLVRRGGLIAFHDTAISIPGEYNVPKLIKQIRAGKFGTSPIVQDIFHSKNLGISWYIK